DSPQPARGALSAKAPGPQRAARLAAGVSSLLPSWFLPLLARLAVERVRPAPAAVLAKLDPVGRVPLRLLRLVVASLAVRASERDRDSDSGGHSLSFSFGAEKGWRRKVKVAAVGLEPTTRGL